MEEQKIFYIKFPKEEYIILILLLLGQFLLPILIPNNIFIIIWVNLFVLFFCYQLFVMFLVNKFKNSYIEFNDKGIKVVNHFKKAKEYLWKDFNGYIKIDSMIFLRMNKNNLKIYNKHLANGTIYEIINIIEGHKINMVNNENTQ